MRCTAPVNSIAGKEARAKAKAYAQFCYAARAFFGPFAPIGTPPRFKRGKGKVASAIKIERRVFH